MKQSKINLKIQKDGFLSMLSGTLCATLFVNLFVSKVVHGDGGVIRAGEGTIRAWYDFNTASHLLEFFQEIIYLR